MRYLIKFGYDGTKFHGFQRQNDVKNVQGKLLLMNVHFSDILQHFCLDGTPVSCEPFGNGHVNKTYLVIPTSAQRYILQMIGPAFKNIHALQSNVAAVSAHLHTKTTDPHGALTLIPTADGRDH